MVLVVALVLYCWFGLIAMTVSSEGGGNVTYDHRSLIINGKHTLLFSGSIHYPRSTPQMWPSLIAKAKAGGLDVIQTYVFWGLHEPHSGTFDFTGGNDLVRFIKEIQAQGLYACLRIGPFIEAEWNYGGLPFWLHDVPGIVFRSDNEPFKYYMERFVTKIVTMMKSEKLYASQGGPIVLLQIENEYGKMEKLFRKSGEKYLHWAADMAVGLETGVPWVMCKQDDTPDPLINACNGRRCGETFKGPNSPNKPAIWTENWTSFYQNYGRGEEIRTAQDIAFHVALFIARKGSYVNYYMYHGGTNFGRVASSYMVTSYYDQAPLDEYGMLRQPKWGHLKELHAAIKLGLKPLLSGKQFTIPLGKLQQGYVFKSDSGECVAFLVNNDERRKNAVVNFQNSSYDLPPKSISILPDCKSVVFNSAKVTAQYSTRSMESSQKLDSSEKWEEYTEDIPNFDATSIRASTLLEHTNVTKDGSDFLWYTFSFQRDSPDAQSLLSVKSKGHVVQAFVNGVFVGSAHGDLRSRMPPLKSPVQLNAGSNYVSLLSVMVGLPDSGPYLESRYAGLHSVKIENNDGSQDFSSYQWGYQVGLFGERAKIYTYGGSGKVNWNKLGSSTLKPLTWYKTSFDAPAGDDPVALNLGSMGKGHTWVNGHSIGRYWESFRTYNGTPSQTWYNVPRSFLKPSGNLLVLLEEEWGNPLEISVAIVTTSKICGHVYDSYPPPVNTWRGLSHHGRRPKVQLRCPCGRTISKILFASFGTPWGDCGSYAIGGCHSSHSSDVVEKACIGKSMCTVPVSAGKFEDDPCTGVAKGLLVDAECS